MKLLRATFSLIDVIVLFFYGFFVSLFFAALFGWFSRFVVLASLALLTLFIFLFRKRIVIEKKYLWFFLTVPITAGGIGFLRGFFTGDAYILWLPVARDLVQNGAFFSGFADSYYFARMPLLSLLFAATFSVFNTFKEIACIWIPFFFSAATLILICQWAKEKGLKKNHLVFLPFLFLTNVVVAFYGSWNLLQEPLVLFFGTAFFYYYEKYLTDKTKKSLLFSVLSFVLVCASKISGLFLFIVVAYLFIRTKEKSRLFSYLSILSLPILFWLVRNYLVFDNPVFPVFNSIIGGRYADIPYRKAALHIMPTQLSGIWRQFYWVIKEYFWIAFPFILLSFYGFAKRKRYEYLLLIPSFFVLKENFLFTRTDASARYFFVFFGLLLVYALLGLKRVESRILISLLTALALAGILLVPVTDSTSSFISLFENRLSILGSVFAFLHNYWYLVVLFLSPLIFYTSRKKEDIKLLLVLFYSFHFLHLKFIANKSWLNTWPFILLALILLFVLALGKRVKCFKQIAIALIVLTIVANTWLMASVYYWQQGGVTLPVPYLWETNRWVRGVLNNRVEPEERGEIYIVSAVQPEYFLWYTDFKPLQLLDYNFLFKLREYSVDTSAEELWQMLKDNKVKYIIKNATAYDMFADEFIKFFEKVESYPEFNFIGRKAGDQCMIWEVY